MPFTRTNFLLVFARWIWRNMKRAATWLRNLFR